MSHSGVCTASAEFCSFLAGVYFPSPLPLEPRVNESSPPGKETEKKNNNNKRIFDIKHGSLGRWVSTVNMAKVQ